MGSRYQRYIAVATPLFRYFNHLVVISLVARVLFSPYFDHHVALPHCAPRPSSSLCPPVLHPSPPPPPSSPTTSLAPGPTIHLFLIAGQSNAVGYNVDPFTPEDTSDPRILQLSCCTAGRSLPPSSCYLNISSDPLMPCQGAHVSFAMSFARALLPVLHPQDVIVLVPTAISGTGFVDGVWTAYVGTGFIPSVAMLRRAWELIGEGKYESFNRRFAGVLWHQGECDAGDNGPGRYANTTQYLENDMTPLIGAFRNTSFLNFTSPNLPFMAGQMLPSWSVPFVNTPAISPFTPLPSSLHSLTLLLSCFLCCRVDNSTHPIRQGVKIALALLPQYFPYTGFADSYGLLGDPHYLSGLDNEVRPHRYDTPIH